MNRDKMKFWYQLTEWQMDIEGLKFALDPLKHDEKPHMILRDSANRLAVFTEGKNLDGEWYRKARNNFDEVLHSRLQVEAVWEM